MFECFEQITLQTVFCSERWARNIRSRPMSAADAYHNERATLMGVR
jgi:hypothetical protein